MPQACQHWSKHCLSLCRVILAVLSTFSVLLKDLFCSMLASVSIITCLTFSVKLLRAFTWYCGHLCEGSLMHRQQHVHCPAGQQGAHNEAVHWHSQLKTMVFCCSRVCPNLLCGIEGSCMFVGWESTQQRRICKSTPCSQYLGNQSGASVAWVLV